jgi:hypothetical protein
MFKERMVLGMNQSKWFDPKSKTKIKYDYPKLTYLVNRF